MPSKKKKSKAKGRKPAAGKGGANKAADNVSANEVQKKGTLGSEMQRLKIGEQKGDEDALLEEAIKLAAVEEQEMKVEEKENCTHGYNPSSRIQKKVCENFLNLFRKSYHSKLTLRVHGNVASIAIEACKTALDSFLNVLAKNGIKSNNHIMSFCLAEGTKNILDGKSHDAGLCAVLALCHMKRDPCLSKLVELIDGDEHTLVQFFRKQISCSCLDEKYKEVKSKMGVCFNNKCPLPGHRAVRSKMLRCTGCIRTPNDRENTVTGAMMSIIAQESARRLIGQCTKNIVVKLLKRLKQWAPISECYYCSLYTCYNKLIIIYIHTHIMLYTQHSFSIKSERTNS